MRTPNLLHVTTLRSGCSFVAANIGFSQQGTVALDLLAYSPFLARHSPGKIHVLLLAERLVEEGFTKLDLTPDGGWKERLATSQDTVHKLTIYFRRGASLKSWLGDRVKGAAKQLLRKIGVNPQRLAEVYRRAKATPVRSLADVLHRYSIRLFRTPGLHIYTLEPTPSLDRSDESHTALDHLDHLLAGVDGAGRQQIKDYLSSALKRLEAGCRLHTSIRDGKLQWSCWSFAANGQMAVPEVEAAFVPPEGSAVLFGFHSPTGSEVGRRCLQEVRGMVAGTRNNSAIYLLIDVADRITRDIVGRLGGVRTGFLSKVQHPAPASPKGTEPLAE